MAKPFAERAGSGMHLHVSINDAKGRNIMAADALPRRGDFLLRDGEGERVSGKTEN